MVFWMPGLLAWALLPQAQGSAQDPRENFRPLMTLIWAGWGRNMDQFAAYVDAAVERGCNTISIHIPWRIVEPAEGKFAWGWLDERMDHVARRGLRIWPRVEMGASIPSWVGADHLAWTLQGRPFVSSQNKARFLCFSDPQVHRWVGRLMHTMADRYENRYAGVAGALPHPVLFWSVHFSPPCESEYAFDKPIDFNPQARRKYVEWLRRRHESIKLLNHRWRTRFRDFAQVTPEASPRLEFQAFRIEELAAVLKTAADAVHKVPGAKFGVQFGSIWDSLSRARGTRDATKLIRHADWIVVDDGFQMDWAFSMDYLRSVAQGRRICNEIDGPWHPYISDEKANQQWRVSLAHGVDGMSCANWATKSLRDKKKWTFWEPLAEALRRPKTRVRPRRAIFLSMAGIVNLPDEIDVYAAARKVYEAASDRRTRPVDFLTDGMILEHPGLLDRYTKGIYLPELNTWMTEAVYAVLSRAKVPLLAADPHVGILDEYGRRRLRALPGITVVPELAAPDVAGRIRP